MFLNPLALAGLLAASLPIVLHLIHRARRKRVRWGAMIFLARDPHASRIGRLPRVYLLLAVRCAIIVTLALALARPVLGLRVPGGSCTIIILDRSRSMSINDAGGPRFDAARQEALKVLASLRRSDEAAVVFAPEWSTRPPIVTSDFQRLATSITDARVFNARADLSAALGAAARLLHLSRSTDRRIVLISDRQAENWNDVTDSFAQSWRAAMNDAPPRVLVVPVGGGEAANIAVLSARPVNRTLIRGTPALLDVVVANYAPAARRAVPLTLTSAGHLLYSGLIDLEAGQTRRCRCPVRFDAIGSQVITARLGEDEGGADDSLDCAVDVRDALDVLIITGSTASSDVISAALAPFSAAGLSGADPARVHFVDAEAPLSLDVPAVDVVVLADVRRPGAPLAARLEQFVYDGGGLIVAASADCDPDAYNAQLFREGSGLLAGACQAPAADDGLRPTSLLDIDREHPIFSFLGPADEQTLEARFASFLPVVSESVQGGVLARYANGRPFMVEHRFGRGRTLLITGGLDARNSSLPFSGAFVPMMQSAVRFVREGVAPEQNLSVGQPMIALVADATISAASIEGPDRQSSAINLVSEAGGSSIRVAAPGRPATYRLRLASPRGERMIEFVVQPDREESDITPLSKERWDRLAALLGFRLLDGPSADPVAALAASWHGRELWPIALTISACCALLELFLARRWTETPA